MAKKSTRTQNRRTHAEHISVDPPAVRQQIAERAYLRFCERGGEPGHDVEDWLAAETEILAANGAK